MVRRSNNNLFILIGLLIVIGLVAWSCTRKKENINFPEDKTAIHFEASPSLNQSHLEDNDYELIYGNPQESFGMGAGASSQTTNEWTLLG